MAIATRHSVLERVMRHLHVRLGPGLDGSRQNCLRAETIGALNNDWTKYRYSGPVLGEPGVVLERAVVAWGHRDEYPHDVVLTWHRYVERAPPGEGRKMVRPGGTVATFCPPLAPLAPHDLVFRLPNH